MGKKEERPSLTFLSTVAFLLITQSKKVVACKVMGITKRPGRLN